MEKFSILCPGSGVLFENVKKNITYKRAKKPDLSQQVTTRMQHVNIRLTTGMHKNLFHGRGFAEHLSSQSWSVSENAHNS